MSRFTRLAALGLLPTAALVQSAAWAPAQAPAAGLDGKELAKAKFALTQADPAELARAKLDTARREHQARLEEFSGGGKLRLDWVEEIARHLRESELAVSLTEADRVSAHEKYWERTREDEVIARARHDAGRIPTEEYLLPQHNRLEAEIQLLRALARAGGAPAVVGGELVQLDPLDSMPLARYSMGLARDKFTVTQADPRELARAKVEAARRECELRARTFHSSYWGLSAILDASRRWVEADLATRDDPAARVAAVERHWEVAWTCAVMAEEWYQAGRVPIHEHLHFRCRRQQAELRWIQMRAKQGSPPASGEMLAPEVRVNPLDGKELAKAKSAAFGTDSGTLARAKLETARANYLAQEGEFLIGRGDLSAPLEAAGYELEAERALAATDADRLAALERHWAHLFKIEAVNLGRFEAGRIPIRDYLAVKYHRLQAEIWIRAAQR